MLEPSPPKSRILARRLAVLPRRNPCEPPRDPSVARPFPHPLHFQGFQGKRFFHSSSQIPSSSNVSLFILVRRLAAPGRRRDCRGRRRRKRLDMINHIDLSLSLSLYIYIYTYSMYVCTYVCMYVYIYIYIHMQI